MTTNYIKTVLTKRLDVANETAFCELITELGNRKNEQWDNDELHQKLIDIVRELTNTQIEIVQQCLADDFLK